MQGIREYKTKRLGEKKGEIRKNDFSRVSYGSGDLIKRGKRSMSVNFQWKVGQSNRRGAR